MPPPVKSEETERIRPAGDPPADSGTGESAGSGHPAKKEDGLEMSLAGIRQEIRGVRKELGLLKKQAKRNAESRESREQARKQAERLAARQEEQIDGIRQLHHRLEGLDRQLAELRKDGGESLQDIGRELRTAVTEAAGQKSGVGTQVQEIREELIRQGQILTLLKGEADRNAMAFKEVREQAQALIDQLREQRERLERQDAQDRDEQARLRNNQGVVLYYRGALEAAAKLFLEATHLKADYPEAFNNLGLTYSRMKRPVEAIQAFRRAVELRPEMAEVYNNLGFLFHSELKFDQAVEMFRLALQRQGDFSEAYCNLGNSLYQLKQHEKALGAWKRALELDPTNQNAQRSLRMFDQDGGGNGHGDFPADAAGESAGNPAGE